MKMMKLSFILAVITALMLGGCTSAPVPNTGADTATSQASIPTAKTASVGDLPTAPAAAASAADTATPTSAPAAASAAADPCLLVTQAEAEALAGGTVKVESGALPGPAGEGNFCRYITSNLEELEIRTAAGRGDFDNDRKLSTTNKWHTADAAGFGVEAWSDQSALLSSVNVIARGSWVRISASNEFTSDISPALVSLMTAAVERLP
jgi:hypothetical protein